jgi:hypothetical protein
MLLHGACQVASWAFFGFAACRADLNSRIPNFGIRMGFGLHVGKFQSST